MKLKEMAKGNCIILTPPHTEIRVMKNGNVSITYVDGTRKFVKFTRKEAQELVDESDNWFLVVGKIQDRIAVAREAAQ